MTISTPIPALPGPDWTYSQSLETEAAIRAHMAAHGPSSEATMALARCLLGRCAYRAAVEVLDDMHAQSHGLGQSGFDLTVCLTGLSAALHGGLQAPAERYVASIAANLRAIDPALAYLVARLARGTGLQPEVDRILRHCLPLIDPSCPEAEMAAILVAEYDEAARIARRVRLVSAGSGCYPWLQANRYMLRHVEAIDSRMPFNMNVTVEAGLLEAFENGFAAFFDAGKYDLTTMVRGIPVARLRPYGILFNHDCDESLLAGNLAELRALCAARARAFLDHAVAGPRVLFCYCGTFTDLHRLEAAVAGLMRDQEYRLLLVAHLPGQPSPRLPTTRVAHVPMPYAHYNWTQHDTTAEGYRYDLTIRRIVLDTMRELA